MSSSMLSSVLSRSETSSEEASPKQGEGKNGTGSHWQPSRLETTCPKQHFASDEIIWESSLSLSNHNVVCIQEMYLSKGNNTTEQKYSITSRIPSNNLSDREGILQPLGATSGPLHFNTSASKLTKCNDFSLTKTRLKLWMIKMTKLWIKYG